LKENNYIELKKRMQKNIISTDITVQSRIPFLPERGNSLIARKMLKYTFVIGE
jgi:hypothetical protein